MKYCFPYILTLLLLTGCHSKPNNLCECLEQAFVLQKKKDHRLEKNLNTEGVDQEINQLKKHCHHLAWRGSSCSAEETTRIIEKQNEPILWSCGEVVTSVMHIPYAASVSDQIDLKKNLQKYLHRFQISDSTSGNKLRYFPRFKKH